MESTEQHSTQRFFSCFPVAESQALYSPAAQRLTACQLLGFQDRAQAATPASASPAAAHMLGKSGLAHPRIL